jgi:hypothetical protein
MKTTAVKIRTVGVIVVLMVFVAAFAGAQARQEDAKDRLHRAGQVLTGPPDGVTTEKMVGAILELLDIAAAITPDNEYRKDIRYRIDVAEDLIRKTSLFNEKARQYVSFAYRQMTNGVKYEPPKDLQQFVTPAELQAKSQKYLKGLVDRAEASLAAGKPAETAQTLLEIVLMIMTPVGG